MRVKPLTRGMVGQTPYWRPTGSKKPTGVGLDDGGHLTNVPLFAVVRWGEPNGV